MTLDERIHQYVQKLPSSLQEELLDFVQYLLMKAEKEERISMSLSSAMRDMEDEPALYGVADIKVMFL